MTRVCRRRCGGTSVRPGNLRVHRLSLAVSAAGVWVGDPRCPRVGVVDVPNERSSHVAPTAADGRGRDGRGGSACARELGLFLGAGEIIPRGAGVDRPPVCLVIFGLGFFDDLSVYLPSFGSWCRSPVPWPCFCCCPRPFPVPWGTFGPTRWYGYPSGAFWAVWMLNLYNFMDGIDGLAGGEAVVAGSSFFLVFSHYGESRWAVANLVVAAASMGFLVHNWAPARVFMGVRGARSSAHSSGCSPLWPRCRHRSPSLFSCSLFPTSSSIRPLHSCGEWAGEKGYQAPSDPLLPADDQCRDVHPGRHGWNL